MVDVTGSLDAATQQVLALLAQLRLSNVRFVQAQDIGAADAYLFAPQPGVSSYGADLVLVADIANPNATTAPKLAIQGLPQVPIQDAVGGAPVVGTVAGKRLIGFSSVTGGGFAARLLGTASADVLALIAANTQVFLTAPRTYYVNAATGSDANDGSSAAKPFASIQAAVNAAAKFNLNGFNVDISVAPGAYGKVVLPVINGSGKISITGSPGAPGSCTVVSNTGSAFIGIGVSNYVINGFSPQCTGTTGVDPGLGAWFSGGSNNVLLNMTWAGGLAGYALAQGGSVLLGGTQIITGSLAAGGIGFDAIQCGSLNYYGPSLPTFSIPNPVTVGTFVGTSASGSLLILYQALYGANNVTGQRYNALLNGTINTNGGGANYWPGTIAGSPPPGTTNSSGGQYL